MDHQRFAGVADADALRLCVKDNLYRHLQIRFLIHINMTVAGPCLDHGNCAVFHHASNQSCAASGNQKIHIAVHLHKFSRRFPARIFDHGQRIRRHAMFRKNISQYLHDLLVGVKSVTAAL